MEITKNICYFFAEVLIVISIMCVSGIGSTLLIFEGYVPPSETFTTLWRVPIYGIIIGFLSCVFFGAAVLLERFQGLIQVTTNIRIGEGQND